MAPLRHNLLDGGDPFLVLADYEAYLRKQKVVENAFRDKEEWARKAIINTARVGKFSSDRAILQYAEEGLEPKTCPGSLKYCSIFSIGRGILPDPLNFPCHIARCAFFCLSFCTREAFSHLC